MERVEQVLFGGELLLVGCLQRVRERYLGASSVYRHRETAELAPEAVGVGRKRDVELLQACIEGRDPELDDIRSIIDVVRGGLDSHCRVERTAVPKILGFVAAADRPHTTHASGTHNPL